MWLQLIPLHKLKRIFKTKKIAGCTKMTEDILKLKYEQYAGEEAENEFEDFGYRKPQIFIDQLLRMRGVFNREEIRDEVNTIITAVGNYLDLKLFKTLIDLFSGARNNSSCYFINTSHACYAPRCPRKSNH